ncbi:MAG TPA: helix-turn-helix domain-containing protein [Candidatus Agrococcus pullicola]|uniref:Helix-turn-helix domain-containing protein n=1 Tax=Candidatus Agrococcus pullicola TaxID=2838429 RepID=A0A9D1YXW0_9MICO|nr:helix-turn-helix domain-containing protein [Candidatus Agrococcus pullicola]
MAKSFNELAARAKADWDGDTRRVYEAASAEFEEEVRERAELGAVLAAARKGRSLTQPALSQAFGVQQSEISRIERGVGNPTTATLLRLADALGHRFTLVPNRH